VRNGSGSFGWGRGRSVRGSEDSGFWGYADKPDRSSRPVRFEHQDNQTVLKR